HEGRRLPRSGLCPAQYVLAREGVGYRHLLDRRGPREPQISDRSHQFRREGQLFELHLILSICFDLARALTSGSASIALWRRVSPPLVIPATTDNPQIYTASPVLLPPGTYQNDFVDLASASA